MITSNAPEIRRFWLYVCKELNIDPESAHFASTFADPKFSSVGDGIAHLALYGQKRATAHLMREFDEKGIPLHRSGDYWILLSVTGHPMALLRVKKVEVKAFNQVDETFAATEGEGDLSLSHWAKVHRAYFQRQCAAWGEEWREDVPTVCESFDLVFAGSRAPPA